MAVRLHIKCKSTEEEAELRDKLCSALCGSPAYIDSEIAVYDSVDNMTVHMVIGEDNAKDIEFDLNSDDLKES